MPGLQVLSFSNLTRRLLDRASAQPFSVQLSRTAHPSVFVTDGGEYHTVVSTGDFDLIEASADVRRRQVNLFEDLLVAFDAGIQVLVSSRSEGWSRCSDERLDRYLRQRQAERPAYRRQVFIVLTESGAPIQRLSSRWRELRGRTPAAGEDNRELESSLLRQTEGALRQMRLMGLAPELLSGRALDRFLDDLLPPSLARPGVDVDWQEDPDCLHLDGESHRTYYLHAYPGVDLAPGWLGAILDVPAEYDLSIHAFKVPAASILRHLNTRIRDLQAARMSDAATQSVGDPLVEAGLPEAVGLRREIAANQQHAFSVSLYLTIRGRDLALLDGTGRMTQEVASRSMARLVPATFQMSEGRVCTLPLGSDPVGAQRLLPSSVVATLYPWLWRDLRQPEGRLVGFQKRGDAAVVLDTFDESLYANANIGVFGHSGAGKTYLMKSLLLADAEGGVGGFILDPEAEYSRLCQTVGGQWVDLALSSGHSINVMDPALAGLGERDPIGDQVSDLLDLVGTMCGSLTEDDRVDVDEALREILVQGNGTLGDVRGLLERRGTAPRVARSLRRWTEGAMGQLFAAPTNVRLESDFVVFGLRDLKEEVLPVAYFLIAQWIWTRVRAQPRRRRLLFDEVGLLFEYPLVRRFLVRLARRVRKYQGSLCLITQNAGDLLSSDQGLVLATNPSTLFLGAQRQAEAQRLQRAFSLTDSQTDFLTNARRGEFLLVAGESCHRITVAAPPWHDAVLRPEQATAAEPGASQL